MRTGGLGDEGTGGRGKCEEPMILLLSLCSLCLCGKNPLPHLPSCSSPDLRIFASMISCAICLHIVPETFDICPYCSADLTSEHTDELTEESWVIVRTVSTNLEAEFIAGRLRASGIPAV